MIILVSTYSDDEKIIYITIRKKETGEQQLIQLIDDLDISREVESTMIQIKILYFLHYPEQVFPSLKSYY